MAISPQRGWSPDNHNARHLSGPAASRGSATGARAGNEGQVGQPNCRGCGRAVAVRAGRPHPPEGRTHPRLRRAGNRPGARRPASARHRTRRDCRCSSRLPRSHRKEGRSPKRGPDGCQGPPGPVQGPVQLCRGQRLDQAVARGPADCGGGRAAKCRAHPGAVGRRNTIRHDDPTSTWPGAAIPAGYGRPAW